MIIGKSTMIVLEKVENQIYRSNEKILLTEKEFISFLQDPNISDYKAETSYEMLSKKMVGYYKGIPIYIV